VDATTSEIPGAALPLAALADLVRRVDAAEQVEETLAELRAAWPALEPDDRRLLGRLVTGLLEEGPRVDGAASVEPLHAVLARLGVRRLRPGQDRAIAAALAGRDALVVMATGSGKSLCYQAPAAALSGLTVVVSPLIALMADQLSGLERAGIAAAALNSEMSEDAQRGVLQRARAGGLSLLYVAPERFHSTAFLGAMAEARVALLVIDEAHCVSEWGHEFRPDYRRVGRFRERLRPRATMALTATATARVRADIARRLGLRDPVETVGGFDRPNLTFDAVWVEGTGSIARKRASLLAAMRWAEGGKAIVYCGTRKAAEETAAFLQAAGHPAVAYHAGRDDRTEAQEAFASGRVQAVAATNAFGMGVNVPNVRLVAHTALPDSLEQLYQEAGRAGRDGEAARHLIVAGPGDEVAIRRRIARARIEADEVDRLLAGLAARAGPDRCFELGRAEVDDGAAFRLAMAERVGALEVEGAPGGGRRGRLVAENLPSEAREELDGQVRAELRRRHRSLDQAVGYVRDDACRRAAFLAHFGDPSDPAPEGRCCDACAPAADLAAPAAGAAAAASRAAAPAAPEPQQELSPEQRRTYDALRDWRWEVAQELGWPAFRVASNRTIAGIARAAPATQAELAAVRGVGPWLMEAHAARLLGIVAG
jgi:ATP-dependent DNA helicase RecQ